MTYDARYNLSDINRPHFDFECGLVAEIIARRGAKSWCDLGCGTGLHLRSVTGDVRRTGIDRSDAMLRHARSQAGPQITYPEADVTRLPAGDTYDLVTAFWYGYTHQDSLRDVRQFLRGAAEQTAPGGALLIGLCDPLDLFETIPWAGQMVYGAPLHVDAIIWSFTEPWEGDSFSDCIAPHPQYILNCPGPLFGSVQPVRYPAPGGAGGRWNRKAILFGDRLMRPAASARRGQVTERGEHDAVDRRDPGQQPPGEVEFRRSDLAADLRNLGAQPRALNLDLLVEFGDVGTGLCALNLKVSLEQVKIGLCGHAAGDTGVDRQGDRLGLRLLKACVTQALHFGNRIKGCFGHWGLRLGVLQRIRGFCAGFQRVFRVARLGTILCLSLLPASAALAQDASDDPGTSIPVLDLTEPDDTVPDAPLSTLRREDFTPCPVEELRASYEALLPEGDAQAGFAIEEEVLRLCRERQALINEIIEVAAEFPALIGELRAAMGQHRPRTAAGESHQGSRYWARNGPP